MSIYGSFSNVITENYDEFTTVTEQDLIEVSEGIKEIYFDLAESFDLFEESEEFLEEGANANMYQGLVLHFGKIKKGIKSAKKKVRKKEYKEAKEDLTKARHELTLFENLIKRQESTVTSALCGVIANIALNCCEMLCPLLISTISTNAATTLGWKTVNQSLDTGIAIISGQSKEVVEDLAATAIKGCVKTSIASMVSFISNVILIIKGIINVVKSIKQLINDIENGETAANTLNLFRNKLLTICKDLDKSIQKVEKMLEKRANMK